MAHRKTVIVFIDFENLRQSISRYFVEKTGAEQIARVVKEIAQELGDFRGGAFSEIGHDVPVKHER